MSNVSLSLSPVLVLDVQRVIVLFSKSTSSHTPPLISPALASVWYANKRIFFSSGGAGSDGFKYGLWLLDSRLRDLDARVVHILHDEIIVEAKAGITGQVKRIVKDCMENAFEQLKLGVLMHVEPEEGDAWG